MCKISIIEQLGDLDDEDVVINGKKMKWAEGKKELSKLMAIGLPIEIKWDKAKNTYNIK